MIRLKKLVLSKENKSDQPTHGVIEVAPTVTFIAGPNGSAKSRLLRWLAPRLHNLNDLPGSQIEFERSDVTSNVHQEILNQTAGPGPYVATLSQGTLLNTSGLSNPAIPELIPQIDRAELDRILDELRIVRPEGTTAQSLGRAQRPALSIAPGIFLPQEGLKWMTKVIGAVRRPTLSAAMDRHSNLDARLLEGRAQPEPREAFSLLESDTSLRIEVLARLEALTGVRCSFRPEGSRYQITCSRVGTHGEWSITEEADGVVNLLLLLPYLYSREFQILAIDEPEAHLFPGLQQTFRSLIYEAAHHTKKQIILATHSEKIVAPAATDFRTAIHVTIPHVSRPELIPLKEAIQRVGADASRVHQWLISQAYGDNQASIFSALFASEVVLVEGPFDLIFMDRVYRLVGREFKAGSVAIVDAGGNGAIPHQARFLRILGRLVKVIVDQDIFNEVGKLQNILNAMGIDSTDLSNPSDTTRQEEIRAACAKVDVHILAKPGIEHYYHSLNGRAIPTDNDAKRRALISELRSIENLPTEQVRQRYSEILAVLEATVRRMPVEWLEAHEKETIRVLAEALLAWRKMREVNPEAAPPIAEFEWFSSAEYQADETLLLKHRFLAETIRVRADDDPITVVRAWIRRFQN